MTSRARTAGVLHEDRTSAAVVNTQDFVRDDCQAALDLALSHIAEPTWEARTTTSLAVHKRLYIVVMVWVHHEVLQQLCV
jgi:hypothetical protein